MSEINKIRLSGTDYDLRDVSATSVVEVTQQQYDDLPASAKTDNILYIITDSTVDYVTSAQTQSAITQAVSGKQDTLVSSVNIKTINNESLLGSGNIDIQGGGGGVPESAFTAYTASTNSRIAEDEEVTAAGLNALNDKIDSISGANAIEVTQAEYDALVTGGTVDPNAFYIITDATEVDISQYWTSAQTQSAINQSVSGKVNTSSVVSSVTSASTDSEIPTAKAVYDAIPTGGTGGGKAIEAGRGITVTTGETADTVSFNLPISAGTGNNSIAEGDGTTASGMFGSHAEGYHTRATGWGAHAEGNNTQASGNYSHAEGNQTIAKGANSHAEGFGTIVNNSVEYASGQYNVSNSATTTFGDSGNTLFSVGNGTANNVRHNAFEIRQNGDIYITSGGTDIKLQDNLGSSITVDTALDSGSTNPVENRVIYNKIDEVEQVTAAALNQLNDKVAEDEEVTAAGLNALNDKFGGMKLVKLTQAEYNALATKDSSTLYVIVD